MMTDQDIATIQSSWIALSHGDETAGAHFCQCLAEMAPEVAPLLAAHPETKDAKFVEMMAAIVDLFDTPGSLAALARDLGRRHEGRGVTAAQFPAVGQAFLRTIRDCGGTTATPEVIAAWDRAFQTMARLMTRA